MSELFILTPGAIIKQYPRGTARVDGIYFSAHRYDTHMMIFEADISLRADSKIDNYTVYSIQNNRNDKIFVYITDENVYFGSRIILLEEDNGTK